MVAKNSLKKSFLKMKKISSRFWVYNRRSQKKSEEKSKKSREGGRECERSGEQLVEEESRAKYGKKHFGPWGRSQTSQGCLSMVRLWSMRSKLIKSRSPLHGAYSGNESKDKQLKVTCPWFHLQFISMSLGGSKTDGEIEREQHCHEIMTVYWQNRHSNIQPPYPPAISQPGGNYPP